MTITTRSRRITLQYSQRGFTDARTFTFLPLLYSLPDSSSARPLAGLCRRSPALATGWGRSVSPHACSARHPSLIPATPHKEVTFVETNNATPGQRPCPFQPIRRPPPPP